MAYTITGLRTIARTFVRNAADSSMYSDQDIDFAIQMAAAEWQRIIQNPRTLGSVTLTANSSTMGSAPSGWLAQYHIKQTLIGSNGPVNPNITFTDYNMILEQQWINGTLSTSTTTTNYCGTPTLFAFADSSNGYCWPTPTQNFTLLLWYWQPFTTWTPGTTPNPNSFNLPDDQLQIICSDGVEAFLQPNEPQNVDISARALERFRTRARQFAAINAGGRDGNVLIKDNPDWWNYGASGAYGGNGAWLYPGSPGPYIAP